MTGPADDARAAAQSFFEAWQERDWEAMVEVSQLTWAIQNDPAKDRVRDIFGGAELEEFAIGAVQQVTGLKESVVDVFVGMKIRAETLPEEEKLPWIYRRWRVISEREAFKAEVGEGCRWGVNPISIRPTTKKLAHL